MVPQDLVGFMWFHSICQGHCFPNFQEVTYANCLLLCFFWGEPCLGLQISRCLSLLETKHERPPKTEILTAHVVFSFAFLGAFDLHVSTWMFNLVSWHVFLWLLLFISGGEWGRGDAGRGVQKAKFLLPYQGLARYVYYALRVYRVASFTENSRKFWRELAKYPLGKSGEGGLPFAREAKSHDSFGCLLTPSHETNSLAQQSGLVPASSHINIHPINLYFPLKKKKKTQLFVTFWVTWAICL